MSRIKRIIISIAATLGLIAPFAVPVTVRAAAPAAGGSDTQVNENLNCGANLQFDVNGNCDNAGAGTEVDSIITSVINIISLVVGVAAVIMIIVGGLRYITSSGESGNVSSAKNTILYAIIGLIVVALAQLIVRWVTNTATPA